MAHPLKNELFLLKKSIQDLPFVFPGEEKKKLENSLARFEQNQSTSPQDIEKAIVQAGKKSWSYRKAYEEIFTNYAQAEFEKYFKKHLKPATLEKYVDFQKKGGNIKDFRRGKEFEQAFTAEENLEIEQAFFDARQDVDDFMKDIIQKNQVEYGESLKIYVQKQKDLENMIQSLKDLAAKSEKWAPEILDKIRRFEQGWSVVEQDFDEDKIRHEIEYWQGVIANGDAE